MRMTLPQWHALAAKHAPGPTPQPDRMGFRLTQDAHHYVDLQLLRDTRTGDVYMSVTGQRGFGDQSDNSETHETRARQRAWKWAGRTLELWRES